MFEEYLREYTLSQPSFQIKQSVFQANAAGWLREETRRRWFSLQRHATRRKLQLWQQLQEEVCLPVSPSDQHLLFHSLYPFHQPKHLSVWLQVCFIFISIFIALHALLTNTPETKKHNMAKHHSGFSEETQDEAYCEKRAIKSTVSSTGRHYYRQQVLLPSSWFSAAGLDKTL